MRNLGAREAANAIRQQINHDTMTRQDPNDVHRVAFVKKVCEELGLDPTPENIAHVRSVLHENDIELQVGQEYPKYMGRHPVTGLDLFANNADEEDRIKNPPSEDVDDEDRDLDDPLLNPPDPNPVPNSDANRPVYEPGAGPTEPGAPNRPTAKAPVARPTSDNNFGRQLPAGDVYEHESTVGNVPLPPQRTPNPQPDVAEADTVVETLEQEPYSTDNEHGKMYTGGEEPQPEDDRPAEVDEQRLGTSRAPVKPYDPEADAPVQEASPFDDSGFAAADIPPKEEPAPKKLTVPETKGPKQGQTKRPT